MRQRYRRERLLEQLESRNMLSTVANVANSESESEQVADFALLDVNLTSETYNHQVSPRDYLGQVSAWYFGHAT